jgi:polyphosphate kinase
MYSVVKSEMTSELLDRFSKHGRTKMNSLVRGCCMLLPGVVVIGTTLRGIGIVCRE